MKDNNSFMKRIVVFLVVCGMLISFAFLGRADYDAFEAKSVTFVTSESYEGEGAQVVQSGDDYFIKVASDKAAKVKKEIGNIKGYVLHFDKSVAEQEILSKYINFSFPPATIEGTRVITGYYAKEKDYRIVDGKKVNVQIAFKEDETLVGFPMILIGF